MNNDTTAVVGAAGVLMLAGFVTGVGLISAVGAALFVLAFCYSDDVAGRRK